MVEDTLQMPSMSAAETMRSSVELLLSRIKKLSAADNDNEATAVNVVSDGIALIKELSGQLYDSGKEQSKAEKVAKQDLIKQLVERLSNVRLPDEDNKSRDLANLIAHYRTEWLPNDDELVERFQTARAEYSKTPDDVETARRFGWVLHECLKASYKRLSNVKLTEFFLKQFEEWKFSGETNEGIAKLLTVRKNDMEKAKDFLFSPVDAQRLYNDREWHKAIVACEFFLAGHPENATAWRIRARARYNLLAEAKKSGDSSQLANQTALFLEATSDFAEHFPTSGEAVKLVLDAVSERYWNLVRLSKNPTVTAELKIAIGNSFVKAFKCLSLISDSIMSDESDKSSQRKCLDLAMKLLEAIYWEVNRHPYKNTIKESLPGISRAFVSLIRAWELDSLEEGDRDWYASGRKSRPFAARVVLALLACVSLGDASHIVEDNPWLLCFCEAEANLFRSDPSQYCPRMAEAWLRLGNLEHARSYALQVVRQNQTESWRWRLLGATFPKNSQEHMDCLFMASSRGTTEILLPLLQKIDSTLTKEKIDEQSNRALSLLAIDAKEFPGIVLSCFTEGQRGSNRDVTFDHKRYFRVWWKDVNGHSCFDFVPMEPSQDVDNLAVGAPVLVTVSESLGKAKAVKVEPRKEGASFDIYPYAVGVVIAKNESRHFLKIAYDIGKSCGIDTKKFPCSDKLANGSFCEVALFEREGMVPLVLDVRPGKTDTSSLPPFAKKFSGLLVREHGSRNAHVDEVSIDAEKFSVGMLGKKVKGIAVSSFDKGAQFRWRAASCVAE